MLVISFSTCVKYKGPVIIFLLGVPEEWGVKPISLLNPGGGGLMGTLPGQNGLRETNLGSALAVVDPFSLNFTF